MNRLLLRTTATGALISLLASANAAPVAPPVRPVPVPPGPVAQALSAMAQELGGLTAPGAPVQQRLDALMVYKHSPATAAKLAKIYGSTPAWALTRQSAGAGNARYQWTLAPLHFVDADGSSTDWSAFPIDISVSDNNRTLDFSGTWPQLTSADRNLRVTLRDLKVAGQQKLSADKLWFGTVGFDVASVNFEPVSNGPRIVMQDLHGDTRVLDQQGRVEIGYQFGVGRIAVGNDGIDNFKIASRLTGIDRKAMLDLQAYGEAQAKVKPAETDAERKAALMPVLKTLVRSAVRSGTALEIDDISASFHGQTIRASGRAVLEGAVDADADSPQALMKKLVVKLNVRAPMALLREATSAIAEMQVRAKNQGAANPAEAAQLAGSMNDIVLGKLISSGYVRVDGDVLAADIEYNGAMGALRINGKAAELPKPAGAPPVAAASAQMMQARRIDDRCKLPDYPQDVVKADAPLSLTMRLIVKADGSVRNVTLASPSNRPEYDKTVLAAAARCVYMPALRGGKPVDAPVAWKVVRESGTVRP